MDWSSASSSTTAAEIVAALISRGWRFNYENEIVALIQSYTSPNLKSIESELLNMDLRSIGGKSLLDPSSLKKSSHLQGPKVLQVVSVRDVYQSNIDASFGSSKQRRLLCFILTDGHSEVKALEFTPIPSIMEDIIPGTKILLENKITVNSGILCLSGKVLTVMGGLVQSMFEEWQMNQKFSSFSRSSLRLSDNGDDVGPPTFEKFQRGARPQQSSFHDRLSVTSDRGQKDDVKRTANVADDPRSVSLKENTTEKPESRPKEVSESVPVQNQAAAQKLLQKMSQPSLVDRQSRSYRNKGKARQEDTQIFTLDEWERIKGNNMKPMVPTKMQDVSRDEELARKLQQQLDLEGFQGEGVRSEAERIRMSMFSYGGGDGQSDEGRRDHRGKDRGRGRGRGKRRFG